MNDKQVNYIVWGIAGAAVVLLAWYFIWFFGVNGQAISSSAGDWGTFGDFFGGVLNPIIAGAGLVLLLKTLRQNEKALQQAEQMIEQGNAALQQNAEELKASRKELAKSAEASNRNLLLQLEAEKLKRFNEEMRAYIDLMRSELDRKSGQACSFFTDSDNSIHHALVPAQSVREALELAEYGRGVVIPLADISNTRNLPQGLLLIERVMEHLEASACQAIEIDKLPCSGVLIYEAQRELARASMALHFIRAGGIKIAYSKNISIDIENGDSSICVDDFELLDDDNRLSALSGKMSGLIEKLKRLTVLAHSNQKEASPELWETQADLEATNMCAENSG